LRRLRVPDPRLCRRGAALGVDLTLATDRCHILDDRWGDRAVAVKFDQIEESLQASAACACTRGGGGRRSGSAGGGRGGNARRALPPAGGGARLPRLNTSRAISSGGRGMRVAAFFRASLMDDPAALAAARRTLACSSRWGSPAAGA